jgi:hypothetical protein
MAKPAEVTDPFLHDHLVEAERLLDDGDYNAVVKKSVEAYAKIAEARPDVIMRAGPTMGALPTQGRDQVRGAMRPWPNLLGVTLSFDDQDKAKLIFTKEKFSMSDAITYFEYTLDVALLAQRKPAPSLSS